MMTMKILLSSLSLFLSVPSSLAQDACTFCPPGVELIDPDLELSTGEETLTCGTIATLVGLVDATSDDCAGIQLAAPFCCEGLAECSLCQDGAEPLNPDNIIFGTNFTCGDYAAAVSLFPAENCTQAQQPEGALDVPSLCGCPGADPPGDCDLCGGAELINEDFGIPDTPLTCSSIAELTPFLLGDGSTCEDFQGVRGLCCEGAALCPLCEDNAEPTEIDRIVPYQETDCRNVQVIALLSCDVIAEIELEGDVKGFCGCPEVTEPPNVCSMCPGGQALDDAMVDEMVPEAGVTCGELDTFAVYVTDPTLCGDVQADGVANGCCAPSPGTDTTPPTAAPISAPVTTAPTGSAEADMPSAAPVTEAPVDAPTTTTEAPVTEAPVMETLAPVTEAPVMETLAPVTSPTDSSALTAVTALALTLMFGQLAFVG